MQEERLMRAGSEKVPSEPGPSTLSELVAGFPAFTDGQDHSIRELLIIRLSLYCQIKAAYFLIINVFLDYAKTIKS